MNPCALCEPYETPGIYMFGLPMSQTLADLLLWERIFNAHEVKSVVELGTGEGGFSRFLSMQASFRGFAFSTFDIVQPKALIPGFARVDVLASPDRVMEACQPPAILFCDGGHKAAEAALYAPLMAAGDLVVVHDWGTEFFPQDVPPTLSKIHADWTHELRSMSRVFERVWAPALAAAVEPETTEQEVAA